MRYKDWKHINRIELEYARSIKRLLDKVFKDFDYYDSTSQLDDYIHTDLFYELTQKMAFHMITGIRVDNMRNWREAASLSTRGHDFYRELKRQMDGPIGNLIRTQLNNNAELIRSQPIDIARRITHYIQQESIRGRRAEDIEQDLKQYIPNMTAYKAKLIARTEVSKASTALTHVQSIELGLRYYVWRTSEDGRVRDSHRKMDKVVVKWTDPPNPEKLFNEKYIYGNYHAGEIFNCRCYASPIIDFNDLPDNFRYHSNGRIILIRRSEFIKIAA